MRGGGSSIDSTDKDTLALKHVNGAAARTSSQSDHIAILQIVCRHGTLRRPNRSLIINQMKGDEVNWELSQPRDKQMAQQVASHASCAQSTGVHDDTVLCS